MDISEKVLKTIEDEKIVPRPRWRFLARNYTLWALFSFCIIMGAILVSSIIYMIAENDWDIYTYLGRNYFEHIVLSMPYLWISVLLIFVVFGYYNYKYTKRGYAHGVRTIIAGSILSSMALGGIFFWAGLGSDIHEVFLEKTPYVTLVYTKESIWSRPQIGLLGGQIVKVGDDENNFFIRDFHGKIWKIEMASSSNVTYNYDLIETGQSVELIGSVGNGSSTFLVNSIRPWYHAER